jgi:hypothetical protein
MKPLLAALLLSAGALAVAGGGPPTPRAGADIQTLRDYGIRPDDEGLLAYLRGLHPGPEARRQIDRLIAQLGSDGYAEREQASRRLSALAGVARADLERASRGPDAEVTRRARAILADHDAEADRPTEVLLAALHEVARRKTPGAVPPLLGALPLCRRPGLRQAAERALAAAARAEDSGSLRRALGDRDEGVRLAAAVALFDLGDRRSLTALGWLLDSDDLSVRNRAGRVLRAVTGRDLGFLAYAGPAVRARAAAWWRRWVEEEGPIARLDLPAPAQMRLGRVLVCNPQKGQVIELDEGGKKVWVAAHPGASCCEGLADGHRLVGSDSGRVDEYDAAGVIRWSLEGLGPVRAVRRLPGGNTLVAHDPGVGTTLREYRPDRSVCREASLPDTPETVQSVGGGNTLVALLASGRVVELDRRGRVAWEVSAGGTPAAAQRLENGNTLVGTYGRGGRVAEVGPGGEEVWSHKVPNLVDCQRLPDGHTLISAGRERVLEVDAAGKVLWVYEEAGLTRLSAY